LINYSRREGDRLKIGEIMSENEVKDFVDNWGDSPNILFIQRLREIFSDDQIALFLKNLDRVCRYCYDADSGCQCWNEE
jgi:hypothetical protein